MLLSITELINISRWLKTDSIGITSGCFDLRHPYHVEYIKRCKDQCNKLIVLVDSDRLISINKNKKTILPERERAYMVNTQAETVTFTAVMDDLHMLSAVAIAFRDAGNTVSIFKNSDKVYGAPLIKVRGVSNIIVPDIPGYCSTTDIIEAIRQK